MSHWANFGGMSEKWWLKANWHLRAEGNIDVIVCLNLFSSIGWQKNGVFFVLVKKRVCNSLIISLFYLSWDANKIEKAIKRMVDNPASSARIWQEIAGRGPRWGKRAERCNNGRVKREKGLKIENLGSLEQKRVNNGKILKKCSIIDDYLKNIQYLCSVNAVIIIRKEVW